MKSVFLKHLELVRPYCLISLKSLQEYKFNVITNTISFVLFFAMWAVFWNVLLSNVKQIGDWNFPMAVMLTGFLMVSDTLWQVVWASVKLYHDIPSGVLDLYLVRPVQPIFAMIMKEVQFFSLIPGFIGVIIVLFTFLTSYSPSILKLFFAGLISICSAATLMFAYIVIGCFSFWIGRSDSIRAFYRSFLMTKSYPVTIFPYPISWFLTFVVPISLMGTLPVLVLVKYDVSIGFLTVLLALFVAFVWFLIAVFFWKRGLKRYESQGG